MLFLKLPQDIPLSGLEERKSEHVQLLKERIGQLKRQMARDSQLPGNISKHLAHVGQYMEWVPQQQGLWSLVVHIHTFCSVI